MDTLLVQIQLVNFWVLVLVCIKIIGAFYLGYFIVELPLRIIASLLGADDKNKEENK